MVSMGNERVNPCYQGSTKPPNTHMHTQNKCQASFFISCPLLTSHLQPATSLQVGTCGENLCRRCEHTHTRFQGVAPGGYVILVTNWLFLCCCCILRYVSCKPPHPTILHTQKKFGTVQAVFVHLRVPSSCLNAAEIRTFLHTQTNSNVQITPL